MTLQRQTVLFLAPDVPALCHQFAALAHRQSRPGFDDVGKIQLEEVAGTHAEPWAQSSGDTAATGAAQHDLPQVLIDADRCVTGRIDAGRDTTVDLTCRDLEPEHDRRFEARAARALQVERRRVRVERGAQY